ncbi:MAG TPA: hypothetical protein VKU41_32440 [Polyangiaceae bacterium]|nr:hypothetical protein [Polyangiaceae bacterium]
MGKNDARLGELAISVGIDHQTAEVFDRRSPDQVEDVFDELVNEWLEVAHA